MLTHSPPLPDNSASSSNSVGPSWIGFLIAGGVAGIVGWLATFPMDVVKTRVQGTPWTPAITSNSVDYSERARLLESPSPPNPRNPGVAAHQYNPYRTTLSTIIFSYRNEGIAVFYRGLVPTLIR